MYEEKIIEITCTEPFKYMQVVHSIGMTPTGACILPPANLAEHMVRTRHGRWVEVQPGDHVLLPQTLAREFIQSGKAEISKPKKQSKNL